MKLFTFRVFNYKSIIDSKDCHLSPSDGITILAGQNESGKSSLLQALRDYESGEFNKEAKRDDDPVVEPIVECVFDVNQVNIDAVRASFLWSKEFRNDLILHFFSGLRKVYIRFTESDGEPKRVLFGETLTALAEWFKELKSIDSTDNGQVEKTFKGIKLKDSNKEVNDKFSDIYDELDDLAQDLAGQIHKITPSIIMFDDFCDLLPDTIMVSDLINKNFKAQGYQAVKNIESILETDLTEFDKLADSKRIQRQDVYKKTITANFNQRWKQKIGTESGATIHIVHFQGNSPSGSYYKFFVETKDGELLSPDKRSQGFKWFLSFYLHLTAEDKRKNNLIILFDEPGLYLHSKAQADMLSVFEELAQKNQIVYSTHSPYLIDANKLHRARLIINTSDGTKIEKLTTNVNGKAHDALKPIIDAIGLDMRNSFTPSNGGKNVIVEGISDYYYFKSFMYLLGIKDVIYFLPAMGAPNAHLLMELCIGWGLDWLMIFDEKGTKREVLAIKKKFFPVESEMSSKIHILKNMDGIEDMLKISDFQLAINDMAQENNEDINKVIKRHGGKELVARIFSDKVFGGEIKLERVSDETVENFKKVFNFIRGDSN